MAERCPKCQRDTIDYPTDALGRVSVACWSCGWREPHTVRRPVDAGLTPEQERERVRLMSADARRERVLDVLAEHEALSVGRLCVLCAMHHNTLRITLASLLDRGLIVRLPDAVGPFGGRPAFRFALAAARQERVA